VSGVLAEAERRLEPDPQPAAEDVTPPGRGSVVARVVVVLAVAIAIAPIVAATWRVVAEGWIPIGDNAYFTIRARDVFTSHHPLLGTWTSASQSLGVDVNNPGPLLFDLHAMPAKIDGDIGLAIGVGIVNVLCVIGIAVFAGRVGGAPAAVLAMVPAAGLAWTMGSELLFDPWQPHSLLFPFLFTLVVAWAACAGDLAALPWVVGLGSLLFQSHLTYAYLVPALWLTVAVAVVLAVVRAPERSRHRWRWLAITGAVLLLCWLQPLIEQFTSDGKGNLSRLADAAGEGEGMGFTFGGRLVAAIVALPSWWSRSNFADAFQYDDVRTIPGTRPALSGIPTESAAQSGLVAVAVVLAVCGLLAWYWRDRAVGAACAVSAGGFLGALVTATSTPMGNLGLAPHQLRWLWPLSLFMTFALLLTLTRALPRPVGLAIGAIAVGVLGVVAIPRSPAVSGPSLDANAIPIVRELTPQLAALEGEGPFLFDVDNLRFAEPYSVAIQAELQRRGIEFRSTDEGIVRQLGESRRADGTERTRLVVVEGAPARRALDGGRRVAFASSLTAADRRELERLSGEVSHIIATEGLPLSALGEAAAAVDALEVEPDPYGVYREPGRLVPYGALMGLVRQGLVEPDPAHRALFERWAELRYRAERETVALFAVPITDAGG
jgi:hypothetical protein